MENYGVKNRNKKSIERISNAMLEVLKEKEFDSISITEICSKAEVARKTFYRNFNNKEDVIKSSIDLKLSEFTSTGVLNKVIKPIEISESYIQFWYDRKDFLKLLFERNLFGILNYKYDIYMQDLRRLMKGDEEETPEIEYFLKFISGGFWNVLQTWVRKDFKESPKELAKLTAIYMERLQGAIASNSSLFAY
ncbi:TetR/AcrR family transcriptional regulator [uncultured Clostridium sp.]|jgi:AcrR family transcriptional regulator|uniref:TetR/AcrR family transcriptional regulator n=1 Tax=uncultured Clostridium sp. TaxID=59620 RepID=UPI0026061741|nr:TetR/AcrR family transcriptional regulator [uncultured Clostridium sp.]